MKTIEMREYANEFLEGYYFVPSAMEKAGPGFLLRVGVSQAKPNYHMGPKVSPCHYLILILKGEGRLVQQDKTYPLCAGDLFCLFPHVTQEYYTLKDQPMQSVWIALDGRQIGQLMAGAGLTPEAPYAARRLTPALDAWLDRFFEEQRAGGGQMSGLSRLSYFYRLFDILTGQYTNEHAAPAAVHSWLLRSRAYMQMHFSEGVTAEQTAAYVGVNRTFFSKKFVEYYGITPGKYLKKLKTDEAQRLLSETDYSIAEIAQMVGYSDLYAFSKEYKKTCGKPPSFCRTERDDRCALPAAFVRHISETYGKIGEQWLRAFPQMLAYCKNHWSLLPAGSPVFSDRFLLPVLLPGGKQAMLKLSVPCRAIYAEYEALRGLDAQGVVRCIDAKPERGILLLEKADPGKRLEDVCDDRQAADVFVSLARHITDHSPEDGADCPTFDQTADWEGEMKAAGGYRGGVNPSVPPALAARACSQLEKLHAAGPVRLLHGALHPGHILQAGGGRWVGIHPKGILAPPDYEAVPFLLHRLPAGNETEAVGRRIRMIAEKTGWESRRLWSWCFCDTVRTLIQLEEETPAAKDALGARRLADRLARQPML